MAESSCGKGSALLIFGRAREGAALTEKVSHIASDSGHSQTGSNSSIGHKFLVDSIKKIIHSFPAMNTITRLPNSSQYRTPNCSVITSKGSARIFAKVFVTMNMGDGEFATVMTDRKEAAYVIKKIKKNLAKRRKTA